MSAVTHVDQKILLGIEGGGTHSLALLANGAGQIIKRFAGGPANLKLLDDRQLLKQFRLIAAHVGKPDAIGIGLAGAWDEPDRERIRTLVAKVWKGTPCKAANDLEIALAAASSRGGASIAARVLVVSGTGSCCYGRNSAGEMAKVGGWGHILGDQGSGYDIGLQALQKVAAYYDREGRWPRLGARLLRSLALNQPNDLIDWAHAASKADIAALALEVFAAWSDPDKLAAGVLNTAAERLASDAAKCAGKLVTAEAPVEFVLTGSVLLKQPRMLRLFGKHLRGLWPNLKILPLAKESVWGAVELARQVLQNQGAGGRERQVDSSPATPDKRLLVRSAHLSPTEQRNPASSALHRLPLRKAIHLMLSQEARVPGMLLKHSKTIEEVVSAIARAFRNGNRLFYVGAGTSGRLGVLDASECPPTFSTPPDLVQGIMAGGQVALWSSFEGTEDDSAAGRAAVGFRGVARGDVVVGIAASGTTPFVWGALEEAKRRRATTVLVCFNPYVVIPDGLRPDTVLAVSVGPEVLTGSTRLKAGTATKLLLNMFTTLAMVQTGKVMSNLMVELNPGNAKLRIRAAQIVAQLAGASEDSARDALTRSGWNIRRAIRRLKSARGNRSD